MTDTCNNTMNGKCIVLRVGARFQRPHAIRFHSHGTENLNTIGTGNRPVTAKAFWWGQLPTKGTGEPGGDRHIDIWIVWCLKNFLCL